jgi:FkbM family methyltransferase
MNNNKTNTVNVRGIDLKLYTYNRSLELCARMNYETENLDFIDKMMPNQVYYDLGACEGRFSIYAALKGLKVLAFEPNKDNYTVLLKNIELNDLTDKIKVFNVGVGETDKRGILQIGQPWPGGHQKVVKHDSIRGDLGFDFKEEEVIDIISLDSFIVTNNLPIPDKIKIDIDVSEIPFLKGSIKLLENNIVTQLLFELDELDSNYNRVIETLSKIGFKIINKFQVPNEANLFNILFSKIN